MPTPRPGDTGIASVDAVRGPPWGRLCLAAAVLSFITLNVWGGWTIHAGLHRVFATATTPGTQSIELPAGHFVWVRPSTQTETQAPDSEPNPDADPVRVIALDPEQAQTEARAPGAWAQLNQVRFDVLADLRVERGGVIEVRLEGDPSHFPLELRRDQTAWFERMGIAIVLLALIPLGLLIAGVALGVRAIHRRNRALVSAMGEIP